MRRLDFCRFSLNADLVDSLLSKILWTDEFEFDNHIITNYNNVNFWGQKDNRKKRAKRSQRRFSLNVWLGIIDDNLIFCVT